VGPALADQGSGARIGQQALRDTFLAIDEEHQTALLPAILKLWNLLMWQLWWTMPIGFRRLT